jgi:hypothetical protein
LHPHLHPRSFGFSICFCVIGSQGPACGVEVSPIFRALAGFLRIGGVGGIRTLGTAFQPYNGLANRRLQPLGHHSRREKCRKIKSRSCSRFVNKPTACNSVCSFYQASANWATRDFIAISLLRKLLASLPPYKRFRRASARIGRDLMSVCRSALDCGHSSA